MTFGLGNRRSILLSYEDPEDARGMPTYASLSECTGQSREFQPLSELTTKAQDGFAAVQYPDSSNTANFPATPVAAPATRQHPAKTPAAITATATTTAGLLLFDEPAQ